MVFTLCPKQGTFYIIWHKSVLNGVYNFMLVCPNVNIACMIDLTCLMKYVYTISTKAMTTCIM